MFQGDPLFLAVLNQSHQSFLMLGVPPISPTFEGRLPILFALLAMEGQQNSVCPALTPKPKLLICLQRRFSLTANAGYEKTPPTR